MPPAWRLGTRPGTVVADVAPVADRLLYVHSQFERDYYDGYLVAESISTEPHRRLITAAPAMRDALMTVIARLGHPPGGDPLCDSIRGLLLFIAGAPELEPDPRHATREDLDEPGPDRDHPERGE
jgi:hypothetical protein